MKIIKQEKGSITLFVLVVMLFFVIILTLNYTRQSNKIDSQKKQIQEIERQYNVDDELEKTYSTIKSKLSL